MKLVWSLAVFREKGGVLLQFLGPEDLEKSVIKIDLKKKIFKSVYLQKTDSGPGWHLHPELHTGAGSRVNHVVVDVPVLLAEADGHDVKQESHPRDVRPSGGCHPSSPREEMVSRMLRTEPSCQT